jgi:DNA mismatch endonuclease (patch repair protein)
MDRLDPAARSRLMSRIRRADTKPELAVRSLLHGLGYRFRTQLKGVPGRPDIAFPGRRLAILVHGCFWHQHPGCRHAGMPATRSEFWRAKFERNRERDARLLAGAEALGWRVLVVWECETVRPADLQVRLVAFVGPTLRQGGRARATPAFPPAPPAPTLPPEGGGANHRPDGEA